MPTESVVIGGVRQPVIQVQKQADLNQYVVISYSQGYNSNQFNGSNTDACQFKIERSSMPGPIKQAMVRFKLTAGSTSVQLAPTPYWLSRIEVWQNSDREIQRIYNDELYFMNLVSTPANKLRTTKKQLNLNADYGNYYNCETLAANATGYYYLPIPSTWLEMSNPNMQYINGDLWLRLYPAGTPINTDGVTGHTPTLGEVAIVYQTQRLSAEGKQVQMQLHKEPRSHIMLHPIVVPTAAQSYAPSTTYQQTLEAVIGKCPLILWSLRPGNSNASLQVLQNVDIGDNSTVQVCTPSGQDILFNGSPAKVQATRWFVQDEFVNPDFANDRNWNMLSFSNNVNASILGRIDGFVQFDGSKYQFNINTAAAGTAEVQTVTLSQAATAGDNYSICFRGQCSAQLAYNASTSAMATAFNGLLSAINHPNGPLQATFSATAAAGTSLTVTITGANGNIVAVDDLVTLQVDSNTAGNTMTTSTSITQFAVPGFPTTGTYQLILYAFVFANVYLDTNGSLKRIIM